MDKDCYTGEIGLFAGTKQDDDNWMLCDGSTLSATQYSELFSLIGNMFGGDGQSTFKLPDLRGRVPVGTGKAPSGSQYNFAAASGDVQAQMTMAQMPQHNHYISNVSGGNIMASSAAGVSPQPGNGNLTIAAANDPSGANTNNAYNSQYPTVPWDTGSLPNQCNPNANGGWAFPVMQSYMAMGYYICVEGNYPPFD